MGHAKTAKFNFSVKKAIRYFGILIFVVTAFLILLSSPQKHSEAAVNKAFNYQGKLLDASGWAVADGNYQMYFLLYDQLAGGSCLWSSRGTCGSPTAKTIAVSGGIFSDMLGESGDNALPTFTSDSYYLEVRIEYSGSPQTLTPRKRVGSVPQAMNANGLVGDGAIALTSSETTGNAAAITANSLTSGNGLSISSTSLSSGALISLSQNGTAAASNTQTGLKISMAGANASATQTTYGGYITNTHTGTTSTNVGLYVSASGGSNNYGLLVPSGSVGIGTITPTEDLDVDGDAWIQHSLYARATKDVVATVSSSDETIYVDASGGSDVTGDGSVGNPYASITRAVQDVPDILEHDYVIQLAAGTYREQVVINKSGSSIESDGTAATLTIKGNAGAPNSYRITGSDVGADTTPVRNFGVVTQGPFECIIEGVLINYTKVAGVEALKSWTSIRNVNLSITDSTNVGAAILADKETLLDLRSGGTINITGNGDSTADMGIRFVEGAGGWLIADNTVTINIAEVQYGIFSSAGISADFKNADLNVSNTTKRTGTTGVHLQQADSIHNLDLSVTNFDYGVAVGNESYLDLDATTFTNVNTAIDVATNSSMDVDTTTFSSVTTKYNVASGGVVDATGEATTAKMLVNNSGASTVADGASAVAFDFDTMNSLATSGALLMSLKNAGVQKFSVSKDGAGYFGGEIQLAQISAPSPTTDKLYNVSGNLYWNGVNLTGGGSLPSGTTGQTLRHNGSGWVATSNLYNDGTNIGIGGTPSGALLNISPTDQTTAAYGLKFGTDTNLYRSAADTLKTDDNVVIATTVPAYAMTFAGSGFSSGANIYAGTTFSIGTNSVNSMTFYINSVARMSLSSAGGVSITSSSASNGLHLTSSASDATNKYSLYTASPYTNADGAYTTLLGYSSSGSNSVRIGGGTSSYNAATEIRFYTAANTTTTTGTEALRIDSNGFVGVGTTTPTYQFETAKTVKAGTAMYANSRMLYFDSSNDYVDIGDTTELNSTATFTFTGWFRQDVVPASDRYLRKYLDSNNQVYLYTSTTSTGYLYFNINNGGTSYGYLPTYGNYITAGRWHHYAFVYNGAGATNADKLKFYLDGNEITLLYSGTIPATTSNLAGYNTTISDSTGAFGGGVFDARIYSTNLSASDISAIYQGGTYTTNMVHQYKMMEGTGTTATDTGSNVMNGTISGATWSSTGNTGIQTDFGRGALTLAPNTTNAKDGLWFGYDVNLYRSATGSLATDSLLKLANGITNPTASTYGLTFGGATAGTADVNLYRSAADILKTDDSLVIEGDPTAASSKALEINNSGVVTGTGYGIYVTKTGASTTNVGLYTSASGATNNYGLVVAAGNVGIGTVTPDRNLNIVGASSTSGNMKIGNYVSLGSQYSSGATILGNNVEPNTGLANDLRIIATHASLGGQAIAMDSDGIKFMTLTGSVTAGDLYATTNERMRINTSGNVSASSLNTTGTATSSAFSISANSLTSGTGLYVASSTLSSGSLVDLAVTGTAAASNTQKVLNISTSGANATSTQTTYGGYIANTHTGTSSTNVGLYVSANGATTNYSIDAVGNQRITGGELIFKQDDADPNHTYYNVLQYHIDNSSQVGVIDITLPNVSSSTMLSIKISGYNYLTNSGAWEAIIGGYWYANTYNWLQSSTEIRGSAPFSRIRLMKDGSNSAHIVLGETTDTWQYPQINVDVTIAGFQGQSNWASGWSAALSTDISALTASAEPTIKSYMNVAGDLGIGTVSQTNKVQILDTSTTASRAGLYVSQTGVITGSGYAGYFTKTGASTTNVGLYTSASGATTNYGIYVAAGTGYFGSDIQLAQISAPSPTTDKLYNVSGNLYWNGINLSGGGALPSGTSGQTLRHNGTSWTANSVLTNDGTTVAVTSGNVTGTTTSSAFVVSANSLTSGTGLYAASSTLSSGSLIDVAVTGTAAASNTQKALNISTSGANATTTQTTYGGYIANTHTGTTSTNVGLYVSASGASTANYGLIVAAGYTGLGQTTPSTILELKDASPTITFWETGNGYSEKAARIVGGGTGVSWNTGYITFQTHAAGTSAFSDDMTIKSGLVSLDPGITNPTTSSYGLTFGGTVAGTPDVNLYRSAANTLYTDDSFTSADNIQANRYQTNTWYVDAGESISTAISNASDGDVILLGPGTHNLSSLTISKQITLRGSGRNRTTLNFTTTSSISLRPRVSNITIEDMTITNTAYSAANSYLIYADNAVAGTEVANFRISRVDIVTTMNAAAAYELRGIHLVHVSGTIEDVNVSVSTTNSTSTMYGIYVYTDNNMAGNESPIYIRNTRVSVSSTSGASYGLCAYGYSNPPYAKTVYVENSELIADDGGTAKNSAGIYTIGSNMTVIAQKSFIQGAADYYDLRQGNTSVLTIAGSTLGNGTSTGTITYDNQFTAENGYFSTASTTASSSGLYVSHSGAISGTGYGGYFTKTGTSTTNVGLYTSASGATNNYGLIVAAGDVGIGTTTPEGKLDVDVTGALDKITFVNAGTDQTKIMFQENDSDQYSLYYDGTGSGVTNKLKFVYEPTTTTIMTMDGNGSIGIGADVSSTAKVNILDTSTTASQSGLYVSQTGAITGTGYGGYFSKTGASTTNVGLYATASGATNNYAAIFDSGRVGIGTTTPTYQLETTKTVKAGTAMYANSRMLDFDGNNDYVNLGNITELNSTANFTLTGWFKQDVVPAIDHIFYKSVDSSNRIYVYTTTTSNQLMIYVSNAGSVYGSITNYNNYITAGRWHHIAIVYNGGGATNADKLKLYIDSVEVSLSYSGTIPATTADLSSVSAYVGDTSSSFDGGIQDFRIYSSSLGASDLATIYQGGTYTTNMVHQYKLMEGTGTTATDTGSNVMNGTISGATWGSTGNTGIQTDFGRGALTLAPNTTNAKDGLWFGYDVNLYRSAANTLKTDSNFVIASPNITGTTTSASLSVSANSLTTGTGLYVASSTLSSGSLIDVAVTGTAGLTGQKGINVSLSGANGTGAQTTYGGYFSNTHTGTSVNVGLYTTASGGSSNYGLVVAAGSVGIGTTAPTADLELSNTNNTALRITSNTGASGGTRDPQLILKNYNTDRASIGLDVSDSNKLIISMAGIASIVQNDASAGAAVTIDQTGKVGIGTTSPRQKVDVYDGSLEISNTATVGSNVVLNGGFETWSAALPDNWLKGSSMTVAKETVDVHAGSNSSKITGAGTLGSTSNNWYYQTNVFPDSYPSMMYKVTYWLKSVTGSGTFYAGNGYTTDSSIAAASAASWTQFTFYVNGSVTGNYRHLTFGATAATDWLIDDVSATEVRGGDAIVHGLVTGGGIYGLKVASNGYIGLGGVTAPTNSISLTGQSAQTIWMERNTTSNTAGNGLSVQAGGATSGATDKNGGNLTLMPGIATGNGSASVILQAIASGQGAGTTDRNPATVLTINGNSADLAAGKTLTLSGSSSGTVTLQTAAAAGTYSLTLPTNDGDANQVLQTNGSGVLSWVTAGVTGSDKQVQFNDGGSTMGADAGFTYDKTAHAITLSGYAVVPYIKPSADATTAFQIRKNDGTTVVFNVDTTNSRVGIGTNAPTAMLNLNALSLGDEVFKIETTAGSGDNPNYRVFQNKVATTDATVTTVYSQDLSAAGWSGNAVMIEARVVAKAYGVPGADAAGSYIRKASFVYNGSTMIQQGTTLDDFTAETVAGWDCTIDSSGSTIRVRVTGAGGTNIAWSATVIIQNVSQ